MATKRLSGWGELLEAQNRRYEAETERMRVTKEDMKLFICYINVKPVDGPGEQAIILLAQSASDAENKARQFERDSSNGKSWGWPIKVTETKHVLCETKNVAPVWEVARKAAVGK